MFSDGIFYCENTFPIMLKIISANVNGIRSAYKKGFY